MYSSHIHSCTQKVMLHKHRHPHLAQVCTSTMHHTPTHPALCTCTCMYTHTHSQCQRGCPWPCSCWCQSQCLVPFPAASPLNHVLGPGAAAHFHFAELTRLLPSPGGAARGWGGQGEGECKRQRNVGSSRAQQGRCLLSCPALPDGQGAWAWFICPFTPAPVCLSACVMMGWGQWDIK